MTLRASEYTTLNEAVTSAVTQRRDLFIDAGDHRVTETIRQSNPMNIKIWGAGNVSRVIPTFDRGDIFHIGHFSAETQNILFEDFAIVPPAEGRFGWGIRLDKCVRTSINNVDVGNPETARHHGGIWLNGYDDTRIDDCNIYARHKGIMINGQKDQSYGADVVLGGGLKIQNHKHGDFKDHEAGSVGIHLAGGQGGTYIDTTQVIYCGIGVLIDQSCAGVMNREVFMNTGTVIDSCVEDGIRVMEQSVGTLQMTGVWSASHGRGGDGNGIRVQSNQTGIAVFQITGGRFFNCHGDGIAVNGGYLAGSGTVVDHNKGYGLHIPNGNVRGGFDPLFSFNNRHGHVRNQSGARVRMI